MKIKDDKGKHEIIDAYGISYVSMESRKVADRSPLRRKSKRVKKHFVSIEFNGHDFGLTLEYKDKSEAKAAYSKVVRKAQEERY